MEAFFSFVLFRVASPGSPLQLQEVAVEGIINFCRQPNFIIEVYVNYDCDPTLRNVFEETGKLLCKYAFPTGAFLTSIQVQAFEGLAVIFHYIADNIDKEDDSSPSGPYPVEISEYRPFWEEQPKGDANNNETWIDYVRFRKVQKRKILIAGSHFNRDDKKGLEYLKISQLISEPPDPKAYAYFFRYTPKLDKKMIGDYLGDPGGFHIQVLKEFTNTFEFTGMILDTALRTYLETFRLPGESQKIQRIVEAFSERFYDQQSADFFANKDSVMVFCYSIIMLNTDQHNPQVKKKMTEEDFIRNNRTINGGRDLPREYLSELYQSISTNAISLDDSGAIVEMNPNRWIQLTNRAKIIQPFILCDFDRRLGRDMFAAIAGPSVATVAAVFEHSDEEEILHECIEVLFSIARIAQYGLEDTLDELLCSFCKFTTLLNPYASAEETLYGFSHDMKPKMAILAVFTIANTFKDSIRGGWRTIIDCLLKLKRLKLLPQSIMEPDNASNSLSDVPTGKSEAGVIFPSQDPKFCNRQQNSGITARFLNFMSMESVEEALNLGLSEFEQNMAIIQQCRIGSIFSTSSSLPEDSLLNLGRCIIFAAAGKGQKFSTPVEEEETVGFCWELISSMALANTHRLSTFWPYYHEYLLEVAQFPLFSPIPFSEKAIVSLMKTCLKLLASDQLEGGSEELIFKSINLMWRMEKEILETCCEFLLQSASKIITEYPRKLQTQLGWMSVLHLLSVTGRHPETYDRGVETLIQLMSDGIHITRTNYSYCIDCAFAFVALRNSRVEKNVKIMDLLVESASLLVEWYKGGYSDPGSSSISIGSNGSSPSVEESGRIYNPISFFQRLGESLKKTSLARREEVRNHAVMSLQRSFLLAEDLLFTPTTCINAFYNVIFAMVDDLHEKMLQYSRRENAERETRSMEGTLKLSMEVLTHLYLHFLKPISESNNFRTFWLGILRRMDTCMKADLGEYGESKMPHVIPDLLKEIVMSMKEKEILRITAEDDLWDTTFYQIQWIAPALTDELFPEGLKNND